MTNTVVNVLVLAGVGLAVISGLAFGLLRLLKRQSVRKAAQIQHPAALPRWSTLHLEEVARIRARPKRLPRHYQGFRPWEGIQPPQSSEH